MAKKKSIFERMKDNPAGDWSVSDVKKLCDEYAMILEAPSHGSHYKVISSYVAGHITIPFKRPIKAVYIRALVSYVSTHIEMEKQERMDLLKRSTGNE